MCWEERAGMDMVFSPVLKGLPSELRDNFAQSRQSNLTHHSNNSVISCYLYCLLKKGTPTCVGWSHLGLALEGP